MNTRSVSFITSALIHALVIFALFSPHKRGENNTQEKKNEANFVHVRLIPRTDSKVSERPVSMGTGMGTIIISSPCTGTGNLYDGVGLYYMAATGLITQVPKEYPAYRNGVRIGDRVLNNMFTDTVDGYLLFDVERYGQYISFRIKKEKICFIPDELIP